VTLTRPLNKGQGHSFWYQSISHIRLPIGSNSNFCSRTHRLATIHNVTDDDRQTTDDDDDRRNSVAIARPLVRSAKNGTYNEKFCVEKMDRKTKHFKELSELSIQTTVFRLRSSHRGRAICLR